MIKKQRETTALLRQKKAKNDIRLEALQSRLAEVQASYDDFRVATEPMEVRLVYNDLILFACRLFISLCKSN